MTAENQDSKREKDLRAALNAISEQIQALAQYDNMLAQYTPALVEPELLANWLPTTINVLKHHVAGNFIDEVTRAVNEPVGAPPDLGMYEDHFSPNSFNKNRDWADRYRKKLRNIAEVLGDTGVKIKNEPERFLYKKAPGAGLAPTEPNTSVAPPKASWPVRLFHRINGWTGVIILGAIGSILATIICKFLLHW
jgi:hypothetical protein